MKQKVLKSLMLIAVLLTSNAVWAYTFEVDGIYYNIISAEDKTVEVTSGTNKYYGNIVIPSTITIGNNTYSVVMIGSSAFFSCGSLTSVTIPNSVTSIGDKAFCCCSSLIMVNIGNNVSMIGSSAFSDCGNLTSITLPNSVTSIGDRAFQFCYELKNIECNATTPPTCGDYVFFTTNVLLKVPFESVLAYKSADVWKDFIYYAGTETDGIYYIPASENEVAVTYKDNNFNSYNGDVVIPSTITINKKSYFVTSIGEYAFRGSSGLISVTIPNSATSIGKYAFYDCDGLTSVAIPNSITSIGKSAFLDCGGLTSVTIPNSVTKIDEYAFNNCSKLSNIECKATIPPTCGNHVFFTTNVLLKVPFESVLAYKSANVWKDFTYYASCEIGGVYCLPISENEVAVTYKDKNYNSYSGDVVIPSTITVGEKEYKVTSIGEYTFYNCSGLTSVTIPNSVTSIGDYAFYSCDKLASITIPNSVTSIGDYAFCSCDKLASITIPNSVITIGDGAFSYCRRLTSITIPNSVISLGNQVFMCCEGLIAIIVEQGNTQYDSRDNCNAIIETATNTLIQGCITTVIPNSVVAIGSSAFYNCNERTSIIIPSGVTAIGEYAFGLCRKLTSITIPNSVTSIGGYAFLNCDGLASVTIPNSVTSISGTAFDGCTALISIKVEQGNLCYDSRENCNAIIETNSNKLIKGCKSTVVPTFITSIGDYAFSSCVGLTSIVMPNGVTSIGDYAFSGCRDLISVTIPSSVTSIGSSAFAGCDKIISITIPNSVKNIGARAFYECSSLTSIVIPEGGTTIDIQTFQNCSSLTSVTIPNSIKSIGLYAFRDCSNLTEVICKSVIPATLGGNVFYNIPTTATLYVPKGSKDAYANAEGWSQFTNIVESESLITSITLDYATKSLLIGEIASLQAIITPTNATNQELVWTSSDDAVAAVDAQGLVTAISAGTATITATTTDGTNLSASCEVTIIAPQPETVAYSFVSENVTTLHGKQITLPVSLVNNGNVSAFQFDVYLPEGITIPMDDEEEYGITLNSDRATSSHNTSTSQLSDGAIRYACYSTKSSAFKGESGTELFSLPLDVASNIEGDFTIEIKNIVLSSSEAEELECADMSVVIIVKAYDLGDSNGDGKVNIIDVVNTTNYILGKGNATFIEEAADVSGDGKINIVDVVGITNIILNPTVSTTSALLSKSSSLKSELVEITTAESVFIEDFTIQANETKTIDVNLTNTIAYSAIQFDLYLPAGLVIDSEEEDGELYYLLEKTSRLTNSHSIEANEISEGVYRVALYSSKNSNIKLNEGAFMRIPLIASANMTEGEYKVEIKDVVLSTSDSQGIYPSNTSANLTVYPDPTTGVENILEDNAEVEYYNLQGVKVQNPEKGVYIKRHGNKITKVVVK